jgi:hypothetical protein
VKDIRGIQIIFFFFFFFFFIPSKELLVVDAEYGSLKYWMCGTMVVSPDRIEDVKVGNVTEFAEVDGHVVGTRDARLALRWR